MLIRYLHEVREPGGMEGNPGDVLERVDRYAEALIAQGYAVHADPSELTDHPFPVDSETVMPPRKRAKGAD
jgi:hypothetical protein